MYLKKIQVLKKRIKSHKKYMATHSAAQVDIQDQIRMYTTTPEGFYSKYKRPVVLPRT
jgi:ribosomal protein S17